MSAEVWCPSVTLAGVFTCEVRVGADERGTGRRVTDASGLRFAGVDFAATDAFLLTGGHAVLRGMHAQARGGKVVTCLEGSVLEVALDLRSDSPSCGRFEVFELTGAVALNLYLPPGVAHGFLTLSEYSQVLIQSDLRSGPESGFGIRWDSFGFAWPASSPVISTKDAALPAFNLR